MTRAELQDLWGEALRSEEQAPEKYEQLATAIMKVYESGDRRFREHIKNRFGRVSKHTGQFFDPDNFDIPMARAFIADETGFAGWGELIFYIEGPTERSVPILFHYAIAALWRGDFTSLEIAVGGPERFDDQIKDWFGKGYFKKEQETMNEAFAAACMLGHAPSVAYLLDNGVDPYAGMRTGLAGFHYAASSGRLDVVRLLVERKVPMEVKNMYGGTVLGQAIWSAVYEHTSQHAEIIEMLIEGGAVVEPGTQKWWLEQEVPSRETKQYVADMLTRYAKGN